MKSMASQLNRSLQASNQRKIADGLGEFERYVDRK
jgi:hypothetical protein